MLLQDWVPNDADDHSPQTHSEKEEAMNIYAGNLSYDTGSTELREAFSQYGQVDDVRVIEDRGTGRSKGFGFVEMANDTEARKAIEELNGSSLQGRDIKVNEARPREERPSRGGGGGNYGSRY